jgi:transcription initiation factor TFIIA large subunit
MKLHHVTNFSIETHYTNNNEQRWQEKLTESNHALFPWDPQPDPLPKAGKKDEQPPPQTLSQPPAPPHIKQEPSYVDQSFLSLPQNAQYAVPQPHLAQQRAAQLMEQQFGQQASNSVAALQAQQHNAMQQAQRAQQMQQQQQRQRPSSQQQNMPTQVMYKHDQPDFKYSQTDGAGDAREDWDAVIMRRNAHGDDEPMGRIAADGIIRRHVEAMSQRLEGGGLMVPLEERRTTVPQPRKSRREPGPSRMDGDDNDEEIGSDLDDSDEEPVGEGEEGGYEGDIILCLYDKVQRVKNKWKCTLKDGVVSVGGKE